MALDAKILIVSDSVHRGAAEDRSSGAIEAVLTGAGFTVVERLVVPDGVQSVAGAVRRMADEFAGLLVTTGGTGFGPRDLTPEGTVQVVERNAPGLAEAMRAANPKGRLSRGVAGIVDRCLVLNTPGSPGGAAESLQTVIDVVPHALALLAGEQPHPHPQGGTGHG